MARETVRVDVPVNSRDPWLKLAGNIKRQHENPKASSALKPARVAAMAARADDAAKERTRADELDAEAKKLRDAADVLIGTAPGQTAGKANTRCNDITGFRDALLVEHGGNEEALTGYGFEVAIGTAAGPKRKNPPK